MLFRSFAHWLVVAFSLLVLTTAIVVGAELGFLGEGPHAFVNEIWTVWSRFYEQQRHVLEPAAKWIGFSGTVFGAVWTIHKGWHYAEVNLPRRLKEYNAQKQGDALLRRASIAALSRTISITPSPASDVSPFAGWLRKIYDPRKAKLGQYLAEVSQRESEFEVSTSTVSRRRAELVTAYLLEGNELTLGPGNDGVAALAKFEKALSSDQNDLDALELAARQSYALNLRPAARLHLAALAEAASAAGDLIRRARALRFHAETFELGGRSERETARGLLLEAIAALGAITIRNAALRDFELGLAQLRLAEVQLARERLSAARSALEAARRLLGATLPADVKSCFEDIDRRLKGEENDPDDPDTAD